MTSTWNLVKDLPLRVDSYRLEGLELVTNSGFRRLTTEVCLEGGGQVGRGEDVVWDATAQDAFRARGGHLQLSGETTLGGFCERLPTLNLAIDPLADPAWLGYRRWAFESAAFDLALRQSSTDVGVLLERESAPLTYAVSLGLHDFAEIEQRLAIHADMHFKLDATPDWSDTLCQQLAATGAVDVVDFKGAYSGTPVDVAASITLYRRVLDAMPDVLIEDPHDKPEILALLHERNARIAWDAPIHCLADVDAMPMNPHALNIKPSRFGTLARLFETYEACEQRGLHVYGGGQFELGVGRRQIQLLASLFHPDSSNDVAPRGYHRLHTSEPRPASPLQLEIQPHSFDLEH